METRDELPAARRAAALAAVPYLATVVAAAAVILSVPMVLSAGFAILAVIAGRTIPAKGTAFVAVAALLVGAAATASFYHSPDAAVVIRLHWWGTGGVNVLSALWGLCMAWITAMVLGASVFAASVWVDLHRPSRASRLQGHSV